MISIRKKYERTERNYSNQSRRDIHSDYYDEENKAQSYGNNESRDERKAGTYKDKLDNSATRLVRAED